MKIEESGMKFFVDEDKTFFIEQSDFAKNLKGYSKVEFVAFQDGRIHFVEAKSTVVQNADELGAIARKFIQSMEIVLALVLRYKGESLPTAVRDISFSNMELSFSLVIRKCDRQTACSISDAIHKALSSFCKCWNIKQKNVKVFNEELARMHRVIE